MTSFIVLAIAFVIMLILKGFDINSKPIKLLVAAAHIILLVISIAAIILYFNSLSLKGYNTTRWIITGLMATGMILYGFGDYTHRLYKQYFLIYFIIPLLMLAGIFFAPLRFLATFTGAGIMLNTDHKRYPIDDTFSLQSKRSGIQSGLTDYSLIENKSRYLEKFTHGIVPSTGLPYSVSAQKRGLDSAAIQIRSSALPYRSVDTVISLKR